MFKICENADLNDNFECFPLEKVCLHKCFILLRISILFFIFFEVHRDNANVLLCRICEKDHDNRHSLTEHMRKFHNACEMPYTCQLCNFRSSMYSDVVDHFKKVCFIKFFFKFFLLKHDQINC